MVGNVVTSLAVPRLSQTILDQGLGQGNLQVVISLSLVMLGLAAAQGFLQFANGALGARTAQGIAFDMRNVLYSKIQSLSFSYHDRAQTGQLLTRATSDVEMVQRFLGTGLIQLISAALMMIGALILLFTTNWRLALVMVVIIPVTGIIFSLFVRASQPLFKTTQVRLSELNVVLQENIAGVRVVKAFAREKHEADRYERANQKLYDVALEVNRILSLSFPSIFTMANIATLAVYWIGGSQVIGGSLTIGELVAFTSYVMMAFFPVIMMGFVLSMFSQAAASAERIYEIIDTSSEVVEKPGAVLLPPIQGRVAFEDVTFRYYQSGDPVLKDVSFVAEPGQSIALLGATGSGKSTIINLIPRFYEVTEGRVTVDNYDIRDVTLESLREQIGIVLQETNLFEGTIRENIAFGRPDATLEDIMAAAQAAEAHEFITSFRDGYETRVGERGTTLSGGQKQRVAIARALLLNPKILILDDATSSVDLTTEYRIQKALDRLMQGRTSFVIAQRVATVLNADQILVLDKGEIVARGNHEELLECSEIYAEIYHTQLQDTSKDEALNPVAQEG
ncbi:MAG: ABC transporter ATP-binding protein/permease [Chloroflexi bacterium]|nr:ABC transporter ATP-binding protein/permease [Chloroflexota bacterium]